MGVCGRQGRRRENHHFLQFGGSGVWVGVCVRVCLSLRSVPFGHVSAHCSGRSYRRRRLRGCAPRRGTHRTLVACGALALYPMLPSHTRGGAHVPSPPPLISTLPPFQLAKRRKKVLVLSTDPAHNLSDAFEQQFGPQPRLVEGFDNLYCLEMDPKLEDSLLADFTDTAETKDDRTMASLRSLLQDLPSTMPGIDEVMGFMEVMKTVEKSGFDCVVFDTAPTGHTLRLLGFPQVLESSLGKMSALKSLGGMLGPMGAVSAGLTRAASCCRSVLLWTLLLWCCCCCCCCCCCRCRCVAFLPADV